MPLCHPKSTGKSNKRNIKSRKIDKKKKKKISIQTHHDRMKKCKNPLTALSCPMYFLMNKRKG